MRAKSSLLDFISLATGQLGERPDARPMLLEMWRNANLAHVATYVLADKRRATCVVAPAAFAARCAMRDA